MHSVMTVKQIRLFDEKLKKQYSYSDFDLVNLVSESCYQWLVDHYSDLSRWRVVCGEGYNACDGLMIAAKACRQGFDVDVIVSSDWSEHSNPTMQMLWNYALESGLMPKVFSNDTVYSKCDLAIDAVFGVGVRLPLGDRHKAMIASLLSIKTVAKAVISIDIPSGLCPDSGEVDSMAVKANHTLPIFFLKPGLLGYNGRKIAGQCHVQRPKGLGMLSSDVLDYHPKPIYKCNRLVDSHKNMYGRLVIIGSFDRYPGAVCLAARAAAVMGCGHVTIVSQGACKEMILRAYPSFVLVDSTDVAGVNHVLDLAHMIVIGPGLTKGDATDWLSSVLQSKKKCVIDAGALHDLGELMPLLHNNCIYTPHPGEARIMLGWKSAIPFDHRTSALKELVAHYPGVMVLKGCMTLIGAEFERFHLSPYGHSAMAVAGMGDVLAGVIAMFLIKPEISVNVSHVSEAVSWHGLAGQNAEERHGYGLLPEHVLSYLA